MILLCDMLVYKTFDLMVLRTESFIKSRDLLFTMELQNRESHPLLLEIKGIEVAVETFRQNAEQFYFDALTSRYRCLNCGERFQLTGSSQAICSCGTSFDPTVQYQLSPCCDASLFKRVLHYACSACGKTVRSLFLFDEKLFNEAYFRERMKWSRERERNHDTMLREMLRLVHSHAVVLLDEVDLEVLPKLTEDLNQLVCGCEPNTECWIPEDSPSYEQYRRHIISLLDTTTRFSAMAPLVPNERWDKTHRFTALIFMEHHREINLHQLENDILVSKP